MNIWTSKYNILGTTGPICTSKYNGFEQLEAPKVHLHKQNQWFGTHLARFHEQASPASLQQEKMALPRSVCWETPRGVCGRRSPLNPARGVLVGPPMKLICTSKHNDFEQFDTPKSCFSQANIMVWTNLKVHKSIWASKTNSFRATRLICISKNNGLGKFEVPEVDLHLQI